MSRAAVWGNIDVCVAELRDVLEKKSPAGGPMTEWVVVMNCGTMVRVRGETEDEFSGYDSETGQQYEAVWREQKGAHPLEEIFRENRRVWEYQHQAIGDDGARRAFRIAMTMLLRDGFPVALPCPPPSTQGKGRCQGRCQVAPISDLLRIVRWPHRKRRIFTITTANPPAIDATGTLAHQQRLYDFMFPRARMIFVLSRSAPPNQEHLPHRKRIAGDGAPGGGIAVEQIPVPGPPEYPLRVAPVAPAQQGQPAEAAAVTP
jgi:hypothetical protein